MSLCWLVLVGGQQSIAWWSPRWAVEMWARAYRKQGGGDLGLGELEEGHGGDMMGRRARQKGVGTGEAQFHQTLSSMLVLTAQYGVFLFCVRTRAAAKLSSFIVGQHFLLRQRKWKSPSPEETAVVPWGCNGCSGSHFDSTAALCSTQDWAMIVVL